MKSHLGSNKLRPDLIVCIGFYSIFVFQGATEASWQKFLKINNLHILNDWERWSCWLASDNSHWEGGTSDIRPEQITKKIQGLPRNYILGSIGVSQ